jgi:hypothetical protein
MYSCTKESQMNNPEESKQIKLSMEDLRVNNLLQDFKKDLAYYRKNSSIKDGESKSVDSAVWLLESTLNYSHSFPAERYTDFEIDTVNLILNKDVNGEVNMTELAQKYYDLKSKVSSVYHDSEFENKALNGIILDKKSETDDDVELEAVVYTGEKGTEPDPPNPVLDGPFEEGDNWWYGENAGQCDAPGIKASDAAEELKQELIAAIPDPNGQYFFINPVEYISEGGDDNIQFDETLDNYLDYYLYFASTEIGPCTDEVLCVEWTEMNAYYQRGKTLMFTLLPSVVPILQGKTIDEIIEFEDDSDFNGTDMVYFHRAVLKYGDKVGQNTDPTEIE